MLYTLAMTARKYGPLRVSLNLRCDGENDDGGDDPDEEDADDDTSEDDLFLKLT